MGEILSAHPFSQREEPMPKLIADSEGRLQLPFSFLERRQMPAGAEYWLDERDGDLILHPRKPDVRKLYIEPTTGCNLHCVTCIRNVWEDEEAQMSMQTFERILEGIDHLPELKRVVFTGFGEPLTHKNIFDMIEEIRRRGIAVTVGTNGLLLNEDKARMLVEAGVDRLVVSVDGVKPETYSSVRGAMLAQVLENIRRVNRIKSELSTVIPALGIEFVALKSNVEELPHLAGLASHLNAARILVTNVLPYTEEMREEVLYGYGPQAPLKGGSWPVRVSGWVMWGTLDMPRMHWGAERRCRFVYDRATVVGWDGGVSPCYAFSHNYHYYAVDGLRKKVTRYLLGNVNETPLEEIWMSEEYVRFRSEVMGFHFPSCPDCDLRETCDLRQRNEGCWGWNPSCADCLWAQDIVRCP